MKRYVYNFSVESAAGYQQFYVDAESREEADRLIEEKGGDIYASEVDVQCLGAPEFEMETTLDDFGDENPPSAQSRIAELEAELAALRQAQQKPFMYGIQEPDGSAYMDEYCVDLNRGHISGVVDSLNECVHPADPKKYKVVDLYIVPPAPAVPDDDDELCRLAESFGADIAWANEPIEFHHIIRLTPPQLRAAMLQQSTNTCQLSGNSEQAGNADAVELLKLECPYPCGWDNLTKTVFTDAAFVARGLVEDELVTAALRKAAVSNNDILIKLITHCQKANSPQMLAQKGPLDTSPEISGEESPDAALCDFYDANSWTELVRGLVNHVEQLQETVKRNVKPWQDTFPPTLLPAFIERIKQADAAARAEIAANSPVLPESWRNVMTDDDIAALRRFEECCDDPEAGGHDLDRGQVKRLELAGALRRAGRIHYITKFGDAVLAAAPQPDQVSAAVRDVIAERQRQMTAEGWTQEHDDEHVGFEMSFAAATYILHIAQSYGGQPYKHIAPSEMWPWDLKWLKFTPGPRRSLVKAAALILAEIERIDRCTPQSEGGEA